MKRILSLVLALVLSLGLCVPALAADFSDVPADHPFYDAISWCAEKGIVGGYSDGAFRPANAVSNSNFSVMLSRAFYADAVAKYNTPSIVQAGGSFMPNYYALAMNDIFENVSFPRSPF